jgi:ABC-type xylose transport system permease subunit
MTIVLVLLIHLRRLHSVWYVLHLHGLLRVLVVIDLLIITMMFIIVRTSSGWWLRIIVCITMGNRRATPYSVLLSQGGTWVIIILVWARRTQGSFLVCFPCCSSGSQ